MANGIRAQYRGTCVVCGNYWDVGEMIDRVPGSDRDRAHVACLPAPAEERAPAPQSRRAAPPARRAEPAAPPRMTYDPVGISASRGMEACDSLMAVCDNARDTFNDMSNAFAMLHQAFEALKNDA